MTADPTTVHAAETETQPVPAEHFDVMIGKAGVSGYVNHAYLTHDGQRFWAMWSQSKVNGGHTGQSIYVAHSDDAKAWSEPTLLSQPPAEHYDIARGLWMHRGTLYALVTRCIGEAIETKALALHRHRWDEAAQQWIDEGPWIPKTLNNYAPFELPDGTLLLTRREQPNFTEGILRIDGDSLKVIEEVPLDNPDRLNFNEPNFFFNANGDIVVHLRHNGPSKRLWRVVSTDGGRTFSQVEKTDIPDCTCKHQVLRLSTGQYILVNNPRNRQTLTVSYSDDGMQFGGHRVLRTDPPAVAIKGHDKSPGFTYPNLLERDGVLYAIYAVNRDRIVVSHVKVEDL